MVRTVAAAGSDPGRQRENNEDRVLCDPGRGIFAVVDGVGGESGGEVAADLALEVLRGRLSRRTTDPERLVREAIALANRRILERAAQEPVLAGMSCVLTVAVLDGAVATVGHVGDSRLYLLRRGAIDKITRDHAPIGAREDAGELSEAEAMRHPRRNEIFRDVGSTPHEPDDEEFVDVYRVPFDAASALLLCSDGLTDQVTAERIRATVESHAGDPRTAVAELIDAANAAGGRDNVSVVLVEGEGYARSRPGPAAGRRGGGERAVPGPAPAGIRGAAYVRPRGPLRRLAGPPGLLLLAVLALAAALLLFREPLLRLLRGTETGPRIGPAGAVLRVGAGEGSFATLGEALAKARPGQTVEVAPGRYGERIELADGVALVSMPRGAEIVPPRGDGTAPAVVARGLRGARLSGFRIAGGAAVGLRLLDSEVVVEDVEVTGASRAGVEILGGGRAVVRDSRIHGNPGTGLLIAADAAPRLVDNLIDGNGRGPDGPRPGVEVARGSRPLVARNRIAGNGGNGVPQVRVPSPEAADEIFAWNDFGGLPREQAVAVPGAPPPPSVSLRPSAAAAPSSRTPPRSTARPPAAPPRRRR